MKTKINYLLIGIIVVLCIGIALMYTSKCECPSCEEKQDMTEEEVIAYLSSLNDVKVALTLCNLTSDSLTGENVDIKYLSETDQWFVQIIASRYSWGTPAKAIEITMDDDTRLVNVKCENYRQ